MRLAFAALITSALTASALADPLLTPSEGYHQRPARMAQAQYQRHAERGNLGGGFIEFIFGDDSGRLRALRPLFGYPAQPQYEIDQGVPGRGFPYFARMEPGERSGLDRFVMDPRYRRQVVDYDGTENPGTIVIDTPRKFLFLVLEDGRAVRYGIGVGRPGFTWSGVKHISLKREWPDWIPPEEMLKRRPELPRYMAGGPDNPLGARALYLGSSLYRIHGSNEPWTIGTQVSSGCIRMRNEDVIDLYERVKIGTRVIVI